MAVWCPCLPSWARVRPRRLLPCPGACRKELSRGPSQVFRAAWRDSPRVLRTSQALVASACLAESPEIQGPSKRPMV